MQIRRVADMLPGGLEHEYGFSCEDGCDALVSLTVAEYEEAGGAWIEGHKPT